MLAARGPRRLARRPRHLRGARRARATTCWWSSSPAAGRRRRRRSSTCRSASRAPSAPGAINLSAGLPWSTTASPPPSRPSWRPSSARRAPRCSGTARRAATSACASSSPSAWRGRGLHADPEAILVTTSGQQAIDLAVRALVEPGDVVLCETPTYAGAVDALVASRARIVPIPVDAHGLRVERGGRGDPARAPAPAVRRTRPATTPPAPCCRDERRRAWPRSAAETGLVMIEDDTGAELVHDGPGAGARSRRRSRGAGHPRQELREDGAARPAPGRDLRAAARSSGACWRRSWSPTATRRRRWCAPWPATSARPEAAPHLERGAAAVPRSPRRVPALARAPARRARHLARAARRLQPLAAPARPRVGGGDLRPRRRARRDRLARAHLRAARRGDVAPAARRSRR